MSHRVLATTLLTTRLISTLISTLVASVVVGSAPASADGALPYTDPAVTGSIGLCDVHGHNVLSGHVTDQPFVWLAVGSSAAGTSYGKAGRTAFLAAYQPRQGVAPGDWSGFQLAAASRYSSPAHPMSQSTPGSSSLRDFLGRYPATWDGLVELRLVLAGPNLAPRTSSYDATDIRVTGQTWQVVRGGTGPCTAGTATSTAVLLGLPDAQGTPRPGAVASPPPLRVNPVRQVTGGSSAASSAAALPAARSTTSRSTGFGTGLLVGAAVPVLGGLALLVRRRRRTT
jgi:hypothetical protein